MCFKWFDFHDLSFLTLFIVVVSVVVFIIFFIISLSFVVSSDRKYKKKILDENNSMRVYVIDVKQNKVTYFSRSDLKNKKVTDKMTFYSFFHPNDVDKVKSWIFAICFNPRIVDQYLEVDVLTNKGKASNFSLLKLLKYDPENGLIHLESTVLKFIAPINSLTKKKKGMIVGAVKRSDMANIISKAKSTNGFTFCIRFFYIRQQILENEKIERYMMMALKNEVYPYANNSKNPRQILDEGDNEIILFDTRLSNKENAIALANSLAQSLRKCISVNGFSDSIYFSIGIVENSQYSYHDFDSLLEKVQLACINAQQNGQDIYLYQRSGASQLELNKYTAEVEHLLKPKTLRYLFRPIIDIVKGRTIGYFDYVKAYDSPFSSFSEMSKYASKVGKNRDLLALVARNVIPKFANEAQESRLRLFFLVSMMDIHNLAEILGQIPKTKDIHLVLVFDEQEVNENAKNIEIIHDTLESLHAKKYELGLLLKDKNLLLDSSIYVSFDYFVAGTTMLGEIRKNNRIRLSIHTLIEQLLKYKKPIIATDLEGWQAVELIIKSGITMVSGETISPSNDMLLPIEKKKMEKLNTMSNKYL